MKIENPPESITIQDPSDGDEELTLMWLTTKWSDEHVLEFKGLRAVVEWAPKCQAEGPLPPDGSAEWLGHWRIEGKWRGDLARGLCGTLTSAMRVAGATLAEMIACEEGPAE